MHDHKLTKEIERIYRQQGKAVLVTVIESDWPDSVGAKMLIEFPSLERHHIIGGAFHAWLESHHRPLLAQIVDLARSFAGEEEARIASFKLADDAASPRVMMERLRAEPQLIICGAGHIGQALAPMGRMLDFDVVVIDDRENYASRDLFPDPEIQLIVNPFAEALAPLKFSRSSCIVIVTRGHKHDEACLRILLDSPAGYIGMIGSRRRVITVFRRLLDEGISPRMIQRVHAPIGLDIGARTPAEIAVSILAEVVLNKYGGTGAPKRNQLSQPKEPAKQRKKAERGNI